MSKFKAGDKVVRIDGEYQGMKKGDIDTIKLVPDSRTILLVNYAGRHDPSMFGLHTPVEDQPSREFKVGDKVRVNDDGRYASGHMFTIQHVSRNSDKRWASGKGAGGGVYFDRLELVTEAFDPVKKPEHYNSDPSGVECITITRHRNFNIGNAFKYLWRNGLKDDAALSKRKKQVEDLRKAVFYIEDEIKRIEAL